MMPIRLLITARDVAAALHLVQVARAARADSRFALSIAAQEPAAGHFAAADLPFDSVRALSARHADDPSAAELRAVARELLERCQPDVVLAGLSTPFDAGLDEAVLAESTVPSLLFQDFWGEQNLLFGRGADVILAIDEQAAQRNRQRYGRPSTIVGSARHAAYAHLDIAGTRRRVRADLGAGDTDRVIGFFGQALHHLPGYRRTVRRFIDATASLDRSTRILVRPHPRESAEQRQQTIDLFTQAPLAVAHMPSGSVEDALAACDVVVSLFSICTFDAAYLNRHSKMPIAVPMSLLFDEEIAAYCRQHGNYVNFSHHTLGVVKAVYDGAQLPAALHEAMQPDACREAWQQAQAHLPDPSAAPHRVLAAVAAAARTQQCDDAV